MGRKTERPLTIEEAKWRLRLAASEVNLTRAVKQYPLQSLVASALLGFAIARNKPLSQAAWRLVPTLLRYL